jgi:hypothetical protein
MSNIPANFAHVRVYRVPPAPRYLAPLTAREFVTLAALAFGAGFSFALALVCI